MNTLLQKNNTHHFNIFIASLKYTWIVGDDVINMHADHLLHHGHAVHCPNYHLNILHIRNRFLVVAASL